MLSCVIVDNGEPNVVNLTFENLYRELKDIQGSELLIRSKWLDVSELKNRYVCFVEADCLVSPDYFRKQLKDLDKIGFHRQIGVVSGATAVNQWNNKIYGYTVGNNHGDGVLPNRERKSVSPHAVQVAYIPGAIIRTSMLKTAFKPEMVDDDLVKLSTDLSMAFWERGYRVQINPSNTYVTTESYVNDIADFSAPMTESIVELFKRESI